MNIIAEKTVTPQLVVLFICLVTFSLMGVGTTAIISLLGLALCIVGLTGVRARIDWWILIPLAIYVLMNMISAFVAHGDPTMGYGSLQLVWLTVYALASCLNTKGTRTLRTLCVLWACFVAAVAVVAFAISSFFITVTRLDFVIGLPNALAIFLVLGWFGLLSCKMDPQPSKLGKLIPYFEPVLLAGIAMTLSMGSLLSLFVGIVVFLLGRKKGRTWGEVFGFATVILSKVVLALAFGLFIYLAAERAEAPILCVIAVAYLGFMACIWPRFERFLSERRAVAIIITLCGVLCILLALVMRPSAIATFTERIQMMTNGIGYLDDNPLTGVGPLNWRSLNLEDADPYFNTYQIHNVFIHAGVEFGIIAMVALIVIAIRCFMRRYKQAQHAEDAAFLTHMLIDTGFFFVGIVTMFMLTANGSTNEDRALSTRSTRILFIILGLAHILILYFYLLRF